MKDKGTLHGWNEKRGFGFVKCEAFDEDIFIHISSLKDMARKPRDGDVIYFYRMIDEDGRSRAEYATIKGVEIKSVEETSEDDIRRTNRHNKRPSTFSLLMVLVLIFFLHQTFSPNPFSMPDKIKALYRKDVPMKHNDLSKPKRVLNYSCQGKRHCSQMQSCDEATFYLKNCPNVKIDGDSDGIPCERQHCR